MLLPVPGKDRNAGCQFISPDRDIPFQDVGYAIIQSPDVFLLGGDFKSPAKKHQNEYRNKTSHTSD